jgi:hypothetical protein
MQAYSDPIAQPRDADEPCVLGGAWSFLRLWGEYRAARSQRQRACVEALTLATTQHPYFDRSRYRKIIIFSDSLYVVRQLSDGHLKLVGNG